MDNAPVLEPLSESLPDPVSFSPQRPSTPGLSSIVSIPEQIADRITIGPPPSWVVERELEAETADPVPNNRWQLIDRQYHATRHERYLRVVRKLDTISALQEAGQWSANLDPRSDHLTIHSLAVIRGEQRTENARLERLRVLQREAGLEYLLIQGDLTVVAVLEDLRIGDTLDLSCTSHGAPLVFPNHFCNWQTIPGRLPLRTYHFSVRFPKDHPLRWKSHDPEFAPAIREESGETEWSWKTSVTPNYDFEHNIPAWHLMGRWIQVSDFASWSEVAAGFARTWQDNLADRELLRLAESIVAEGGTAAQQVERALTYLQDQIRYLSLDGDLGGNVPSPPGLVLQRGFGDCKDKAFIAAHLLRLLGIPARPMLVSSGFRQSVREFLPMPVFDHAIVEYDLDGKRRWVDMTIAMQGGTALTRPGVPFRLGLPIGPGVHDLEPIASDPIGDRYELRETYLIDTTGRNSSLRVVLTVTGRQAEIWRRSIAEEEPELFALRREQFYQRVFPHAKRAGKLEWQDDRERNEFRLGEMFDLHESDSPTYERRGVRFRMVAHTIQSFLGFQAAGERKHPWALPGPLRVKHIIELESPGLRPPHSKGVRVDNDAFRFASQWQGQQGITTVTFSLAISQEAVLPKAFEEYKRDVLEVHRHLGIIGHLSPGSAISWRKRALENVLTPRRTSTVEPRSQQPSPAEKVPLPVAAPPCASREFIAPQTSINGNPDRSGNVTPRKERGAPAAATRQRGEIRRPDPTLPPRVRHDPATSAPDRIGSAKPGSQSGSHPSRRQRRKRRQRQYLVVGLAVVVGIGLLLLAIHFFPHL